MDSDTILLTVAALAPAVVLCVYVFRKDRVEKEPVGMLLKLLLLGALSCFPAAVCEGILLDAVEEFFKPFGIAGEDGQILFEANVFYLYTFVKMFLGVALVEEGGKLIILRTVTKNNKNFNCLFDGLIYAIFVSLGFAALENVMYVLQYGWGNAVSRAILSVPGHMFFAVMMGYYYTLWNLNDKAAELENIFKLKGLIAPSRKAFSSERSKINTLLVPMLMHAVYNTCCSLGEAWATLLLLAFVIYMYVSCFGKIRKMSRADSYNNNYITAMMIREYPELEYEIREEAGIENAAGQRPEYESSPESLTT